MPQKSGISSFARRACFYWLTNVIYCGKKTLFLYSVSVRPCVHPSKLLSHIHISQRAVRM